MAKRRGAMTKNPVLRGEARRAAKARRRAREEGQPETSPPVRARPRETRGERLSPGVYRGSEGNLVGRGGRRIQRQPQPTIPSESAGNPWLQGGQGQGFPFGGRTLSPEERQARGIDPRDPNQYFVDDQGNVGGTLIGWSPDGSRNIPPGFFGNMTNSLPQGEMPQMPQASANMGGQYRLSPGVYGTREQAMRQYQDQIARMQTEAEAQQMQGGGGPGNFIQQQRERELGYVQNRFDAARNNNLFRGNPIRRFGF